MKIDRLTLQLIGAIAAAMGGGVAVLRGDLDRRLGLGDYALERRAPGKLVFAKPDAPAQGRLPEPEARPAAAGQVSLSIPSEPSALAAPEEEALPARTSASAEAPARAVLESVALGSTRPLQASAGAAHDAAPAAARPAERGASRPPALKSRFAAPRGLSWGKGTAVTQTGVYGTAPSAVDVNGLSHSAPRTPAREAGRGSEAGAGWLPVASLAEKTVTLGQVAAAIAEQGARWTAAETTMSRLAVPDVQLRLGAKRVKFESPLLPVESGVPAELDWRDFKGSYVTPVKDQGACGACWDFAMTGALESYLLTGQGGDARALDLSEQIFLSCNPIGYSCRKGGELDATFLQKVGLPEERLLPYLAVDGSCSMAPAGWQEKAYRIDAWGPVAQDVEALKSALARHGPVPAGYMVYEDFLYYRSGVYSYVAGRPLGGHAALIVGFSDAGRYFIVKNSFGTGWGDGGYFKIAYSQLKNRVLFGTNAIAYTRKAAG